MPDGETIELTDCPQKYCGSVGYDALRFADMMEMGLPPVTGGALDQSASAMQAIQQVRADSQAWKNKLGIIE